MNVVVSDTSPLNYLVLCELDSILPKTFEEIIIPPAVRLELQHAKTPAVVRAWLDRPPAWLRVQAPDKIDLSINLDVGEREAVCLASELSLPLVVDDLRARWLAQSRGLRVIGTVGICVTAAQAGLIDLADAVRRLQAAGLRLDSALVKSVLRKNS